MSIFNESSISAMVFLRETKAWNEWEKLLGGEIPCNIRWNIGWRNQCELMI